MGLDEARGALGESVLSGDYFRGLDESIVREKPFEYTDAISQALDFARGMEKEGQAPKDLRELAQKIAGSEHSPVTFPKPDGASIEAQIKYAVDISVGALRDLMYYVDESTGSSLIELYNSAKTQMGDSLIFQLEMAGIVSPLLFQDKQDADGMKAYLVDPEFVTEPLVHNITRVLTSHITKKAS